MTELTLAVECAGEEAIMPLNALLLIYNITRYGRKPETAVQAECMLQVGQESSSSQLLCKEHLQVPSYRIIPGVKI